jgi:hypothetical protein
VLDGSVNGIARERFYLAIDEFNQRTSLRFIERTVSNSGQYPDYTKVIHAPTTISSSAGSIGWVPGESITRFSDVIYSVPNNGTQWGLVNIVHELSHVAGLYHENSRLDLWDYFVIDWSEVADPNCPDTRETNNIGQTIGGYDYFSIMNAKPAAQEKQAAFSRLCRTGSREQPFREPASAFKNVQSSEFETQFCKRPLRFPN